MTFYKIKVYARLFMVLLLFLVAVIFIASNSGSVAVKFLGWTVWQAPGYAFIFSVAILGIVIFLIAGRIRKIITDVRDLQRERKISRHLVEQSKQEKII